MIYVHVGLCDFYHEKITNNEPQELGGGQRSELTEEEITFIVQPLIFSPTNILPKLRT